MSVDEGYSRIETAICGKKKGTSESGVFESLVKAGEEVRVGQPLANIIHPYESELIETLYAPVDGRIFFIHNEPLTYANTAVIKLVR